MVELKCRPKLLLTCFTVFFQEKVTELHFVVNANLICDPFIHHALFFKENNSILTDEVHDNTFRSCFELREQVNKNNVSCTHVCCV